MDADNNREWCKNDRKAAPRISLSLSDEHLEHVQGVHSAKEIWQCILNIFERHTLLKNLAARRKFYTANLLADERILADTNRIR